MNSAFDSSSLFMGFYRRIFDHTAKSSKACNGAWKKKQQLSMEPISTIILVYDILYVKLSGIHLASLRRPCEDPEPFRQVQAMLAEYRPDVVRLTAKDMMLRLLRYAQCVQQIPAELDR